MPPLLSTLRETTVNIYTRADAVIKELGGKVKGGINWTWVMFSTEENAEAFNTWVARNGLETRGVYPPQNPGEMFGVRYR